MFTGDLYNFVARYRAAVGLHPQDAVAIIQIEVKIKIRQMEP